jgi:hypothetical protein
MRNNKKNQLARGIPLILVVLLLSCEKIILPDPGPKTSRFVQTENFNKIFINSIFSIELVQDTAFGYTATCGENQLEKILARVEEGELFLEDQNAFTWMADYQRVELKIHFPSIYRMYIDAPCQLTNRDTLRLRNFQIISSGKTGEMDLCIHTNYFRMAAGSDSYGYHEVRGISRRAFLWPRGSALFRMENLVCDTLGVRQNSIADCHVQVKNHLHVFIDRSGDVVYSGQPSISIDTISGGGQLVPVK